MKCTIYFTLLYNIVYYRVYNTLYFTEYFSVQYTLMYSKSLYILLYITSPDTRYTERCSRTGSHWTTYCDRCSYTQHTKKTATNLHRVPGSLVGMATGYGAGRPGDRILVGGEILRTCPYWPWVPHSLL